MNTSLLQTELSFKATPSSGPGGQHVNKVSTRVTLYWSLGKSAAFDESQKVLLSNRLKNRLTSDNVLQLTVDSTRSQYRNKQLVITKFFELLQIGLTPLKKRKKLKPSKLSKIKRLKSKKRQSEKKENRRRPQF